ncbi:MAG: hypothetical protein E5X23_09290 [Mesorhizobium sp.]|uniref:hypothetical protein n=1 Tax=unclassified Mesorhizobium TaxID=325217 RepID=UPI000FC9B2D4|nr:MULTISPECIES: hypothetical protein [unclassified Mesorhizobium]TGV93666.1 hypothetical protein EN801_011555 [Mesorhizobium sp. M00.F.Ca.ET.158.01.1.1]MCT2577680.1 hypothetical protein [Mesorhizobium sp. P13.3]MDF3166618.1 hypothetical protein [Mesorhizobium sp. P16.1]MDF3179378.1 hypothetical protein [Mesorhizobium sp. P17.1]MDF3183270.1 hypothetical protein [Mesorhizobium sp. ICCV3110.1]
MPAPEFDQIDVVLAEDRKHVLLYGYAGDQIYLQRVHQSETELDPNTVEVTEASKWRGRGKADRWLKL